MTLAPATTLFALPSSKTLGQLAAPEVNGVEKSRVHSARARHSVRHVKSKRTKNLSVLGETAALFLPGTSE